MSNTNVNPDLKGYNFDDFRQDIWGDSFNWDFDRQLSQVLKLVIHHSVTDPTGKTPRQQAEYIAQLHKARGWAGVGYHFIIANDGTVLYVGDIGQGRANVAGNNEKVIGICLVGDFTKTLPTAHQILAAHRLCDYFINNYPALTNVTGWDDVWGHKDCVAWAGSEPTTCPSPAWNDPNDSLRNRIVQATYQGYPGWESAIGVTPAPTPTPTPEPTPVPVPTPPPVYSDPTTLVDLGEPYGTMELRKVKETLDNLTSKLSIADALIAQIKTILVGKGWPWQKVKTLKTLLGI